MSQLQTQKIEQFLVTQTGSGGDGEAVDTAGANTSVKARKEAAADL